MSLPEYFLRIDYLAQNVVPDDTEIPVSPERIDHGKFLHVYLTGVIPHDRTVLLRITQLAAVGDTVDTSRKEASTTAQSYKATLDHYALDASSSYIIRAMDKDGDPWAVVSQEIRTI